MIAKTKKPTAAKYGSKVADDLIAGMQSLIDDMKADRPITIRQLRLDLSIPELTASEISDIREQLGLSQVLFAEFLGASPSAVRAWERGAKMPSAMGRRFLDAIRTDPDYWRTKLAKAARTPG